MASSFKRYPSRLSSRRSSRRSSIGASTAGGESEDAGRIDRWLTLLLVFICLGSIVFMAFLVSLAEFRPETVRRATAILELVNNTTQVDGVATVSSEIDAPAELKMKLLAVYLANDIEIGTRRPIFGTSALPAELDGFVTDEMHERRIYTNAECDPDGDGRIGDCDITTEWKYPNQVLRWLDLVLDSEALVRAMNPFRHYIAPGHYRHVVLQTCLQNLGNGSNLQFQGSAMPAPLPVRTRRCFHLAAPLEPPLTLADGDEVTVSLIYRLDGSLSTFALGGNDNASDEYTCYRDVASGTATCIFLPAFVPTTRRSIQFPLRLGNSTAQRQAAAASGASRASLSARERFERECTAKWILGSRARLCAWPSREWRVAELLVLIVVMSFVGMAGIICKSTLEYLWQTGTAPSIAWALKGETRLPSSPTKQRLSQKTALGKAQ